MTKRVALAFMVVLIAFGLVNLATWLRAGQWPNWTMYLQVIGSYASVEYIYGDWPGFEPGWIFVACVYLFTIIAVTHEVIFSKQSTDLKRYVLVVGAAVGGLAQFTYWVANPSIIEAQIIPTLFLAAVWFERLMGSDLTQRYKGILRISTFLTVFLLTVILCIGSPFRQTTTPFRLTVAKAAVLFGISDPVASWDAEKSWHRNLGENYSYQPAFEEEPDTFIPEIVGLLETAAPGTGRVPLLVPSDSGVAALVMTQRVNALPFSNPAHDSLSPVVVDMAISTVDQMRIGDVVIISNRFDLFWPSQKRVADHLCKNFMFQPVAMEQHMSAVRLSAPDSPGLCRCNTDGLECP